MEWNRWFLIVTLPGNFPTKVNGPADYLRPTQSVESDQDSYRNG